MMAWSLIDSREALRSRVQDAVQRLISAFSRAFDKQWAVHRRAGT
jgi:hypothetical protein